MILALASPPAMEIEVGQPGSPVGVVAAPDATVLLAMKPDAVAPSSPPPASEAGWRAPEPLRFAKGVQVSWVPGNRLGGAALEGVLLYASRLMLIVEHVVPDPEGFGMTLMADTIELADLRTVDGDRVCMHRRLQLARLLAAVTVR